MAGESWVAPPEGPFVGCRRVVACSARRLMQTSFNRVNVFIDSEHGHHKADTHSPEEPRSLISSTELEFLIYT
jgi:hypothetical protein